MKVPYQLTSLRALHDDLEQAGVPLAALGFEGDEVFTYDANGHRIEIPKAAQTVVRRHIPRPPVPVVEKLTALRAELSKPDGTIEDLKAALLNYLGG